MARKKKQSAIRKVIIIGAALIVVQAGYLFLLGSQSKPTDIRDAIVKAVEQKADLSIAEKERAKLQMAVTDYLSKNGKPPTSLDELVPVYFDNLPIDPSTNKAFKYKVDGMRYYIGEAPTAGTSGKSGGTGAQGAVEPSTPEEKLALLESLNESSAKSGYIYDPTGKRDPFRPFDLTPPKQTNQSLTPLERYNLGELKLTAVLKGFDEPTAIVENSAHRGFTVKKGTKIGTNNGEIIEIQPDRLLILETEIDFTGQKKSRTVEMRLRTKDENKDR